MRPQNARLWKDRKLNEHQASRAEAAMPHMMAALRAVGVAEFDDEVAEVVFQEALWQLLNVPRLGSDVEKAVRWEP